MLTRRRAVRARVVVVALCVLAGLDLARSLGLRALLVSSVDFPVRSSENSKTAARVPSPAADPILARGRYLTESGLCGHCHTPIRADGEPIDGLHLAGGLRFVAWPFGVFVAGNLTPDPETGSGRYSADELIAAIRGGHTPDRALDTVVMPSTLFAHISDADADAIARYLRSLPPIRNRAPPVLHYGWLETVVGKLLFFTGVVRADQVVSAGNRSGRVIGLGDEFVGWILPWLQVVVVGVALGLRWRFRERSGRRSSTGWLAFAALASALLWFVYRFPAVPGLSARMLGEVVFPPPALTRADVSPVRRAMLERGRTLYLTQGCAVCHGLDGSERIEMRWDHFGTVYSANLTSHETGLASHSDEEIEAALRVGRARDGHRINPRAMPWTRFAGLAPDDTRALIAYLRQLSAVACPRVPPRPRAIDDPGDFTATFDAVSDCATPEDS